MLPSDAAGTAGSWIGGRVTVTSGCCCLPLDALLVVVKKLTATFTKVLLTVDIVLGVHQAWS